VRRVSIFVAAISIAFIASCKSSSSTTTSDAGSLSVATTASASHSSGKTAAADSALSPMQALTPSKSTAQIPLRAHSPAKAGEQISIGAQTITVGSTPGDEGRDPTLEPAFVSAKLGGYSIDALPYPNDPSQPSRTNVSRAEAAHLCQERGERLCSEIEWELACKGPNADKYSSGAEWDDSCDRDPSSCVSELGVRAMGAMREWTSSDVLDSEGAAITSAVRGAGAIGNDGGAVVPSMHRCARRTRTDSARTSSDLTFRCCKGAATSTQIAAIELKAGFRKTKLEAPDIARIFATIPELSRVGTDIRLFEQGDINGVVAKTNAARETVTFTGSPMLWEPEAGLELLVVTGHGKNMGFIVALYPLPDDKYKIASSFLLLGDLSPVVLAYDAHNRKELFWTQCWGCAGEQGSVAVRDDHHVVIVQH
jgi:formylglycine-generating enzyme required for sulfatase activity